MSEAVDVAIVGGGPVGAALALALRGSGVSVRLLEARRAPAPDGRPLALSYGSRLILERLGVWERLGSPSPIESIHVSQKGGFGRVLLSARGVRLPALGYVVDYGMLHAALDRALGDAAWIVRGARVPNIRREGSTGILTYESDGTPSGLAARLIAVADGGALADTAQARTSDYGQSAVVATVASELPHRQVAFERFTPGGPLALLPSGEDLAVVWTTTPQHAAQLCALDEAEFCAQLAGDFGARLGEFRNPRGRASFPLTLRITRGCAVPGTVLIGNAAQTLHPVAGQGFNLGLRDAWELAEEIRRFGRDAFGSPAMLESYHRRRRLDRRGSVGFTDSLVRLFSNDIAPFRVARGAGLALLGCMPPVRDFVARRMVFGSRA